MAEINFQWQDDPYFLISAPPREAGKILNGITDLSAIDRAITGIGRIDRGEKAEIKELQAERERLLVKFGEYQDLPSFKQAVEELEKLAQETDQIRSRLGLLIRGVERVRVLEGERQATLKLTSLKPIADKAMRLDYEVKEAKAKLHKLRQQVERIHDLHGERAAVALHLKELRSQLPNTGDVCPLCKQVIRKQATRQFSRGSGKESMAHIRKHINEQ